MTDDGSDAKNLGQTLFDLMQSGASEEVLGQFALRRAQRLMVERGERSAMLAPSDLEALLEGFATRVVEKVLSRSGVSLAAAGAVASAVSAATAATGSLPLSRPDPSAFPGAASGADTVRMKKISCRLFGKTSSFSVHQGLHDALQSQLGAKQLRRTLVSFAEQAPASVDRSKHIRHRMTELWEKLQAGSTEQGSASRLQ